MGFKSIRIKLHKSVTKTLRTLCVYPCVPLRLKLLSPFYAKNSYPQRRWINPQLIM